jgi:hypothetical protein
VRQPLRFTYRNLVFARDVEDLWALYRIATRSYDGLTRGEKRELLSELAAFAYGIEADFSLLRVTRPWSVAAYATAAELTLDSRHGHPELWRRYLDSHRQVLVGREAANPEVYLSIRLEPAAGSGAGGIVAAAVSSARQVVGLGDPRAISERRLEALLSEERRTYARLTDYLDAERAASHELQWLVRRALCRGVGEPYVDERFLPQALVIEDERDGRSYRPLEADLLRLFDSPIEIGGRDLRIESELGRSHQAFLCLGALPEVAVFPGRQAELLFAPLEALPFAVDACFSARFVGNDRALALVRRRVVDADNLYREESHGDHGPTSEGAERPQSARELEDYLMGTSRPPLLRASISLAVGARSETELEERVERVRREYGGVRLHRPFGEQLRLFCQHLPGQTSWIPDYDDYLLVEQLGAMVPTATHAVGSQGGPYLGHTLSGSAQPVLFDLTEASRTARPPSILLCGTLGSGKTLLLELLLYQAFLQGSRVVDVDPKGDHRLELLPGVAEQLEEIELSADERFRGMLDPLRIARPETAEELATSFLIDVLPDPEGGEKTAIRAAVKAVLDAAPAGEATCSQVLQQLALGHREAKQAARDLAVYQDTGLARLGFGKAGSRPPQPTATQVTSLRIRNLPRPLPGTPRAELSEEERIGRAVLRLVCAYALYLMGADRSRHKVLGFDEAWFLLEDATGRRLVEHLNRWGRSEFATPILAAHLVSDAEGLDNLLGARFVFGMESEREAERALRMLRLDADDERLRQRLLSFRRGRCLFRDYEGRTAQIQIDLADPELLALLDTTPTQADPTGEAEADSEDAHAATVA